MVVEVVQVLSAFCFLFWRNRGPWSLFNNLNSFVATLGVALNWAFIIQKIGRFNQLNHVLRIDIYRPSHIACFFQRFYLGAELAKQLLQFGSRARLQ